MYREPFDTALNVVWLGKYPMIERVKEPGLPHHFSVPGYSVAGQRAESLIFGYLVSNGFSHCQILLCVVVSISTAETSQALDRICEFRFQNVYQIAE